MWVLVFSGFLGFSFLGGLFGFAVAVACRFWLVWAFSLFLGVCLGFLCLCGVGII